MRYIVILMSFTAISPSIGHVSWYIIKSCFGVVHNIELGGGGGVETKFVLSMLNWGIDKVCFVNVQ